MRFCAFLFLAFTISVGSAQDFGGTEKFCKDVVKALSKDGDLSKFLLKEKDMDEIARKYLEDADGQVDLEMAREMFESTNKSIQEEAALITPEISGYSYSSYTFLIEKRNPDEPVMGDLKVTLLNESDSTQAKLNLRKCIWIDGQWLITNPVHFKKSFFNMTDLELICECANRNPDFRQECEELGEELKGMMEEGNEEVMEIIEEAISNCDLESDTEKVEEAMEEVEEVVEEAEEATEDGHHMSNEHTAEMVFDMTEYNFGEVEEGETVTCTFKFTNKGEGALDITSAHASSHNIRIEYPDKSIKAGENGSIKVSFDTANKGGRMNQTITIYANTYPNQKHTLYLVGEVK